MDAFRTTTQSFNYAIEITFGMSDLDKYETIDDQFMSRIGLSIELVQILLTFILIVNLVIAVMTETYSRVNATNRGLFNSSVIKNINQFKVDRIFGSVKLLPPPLNVTIIPLLIVYQIYVKYPRLISSKTMERINTLSIRLMYSLFGAFLFASVFAAINLLLLPFAFLKALVIKIKLA